MKFKNVISITNLKNRIHKVTGPKDTSGLGRWDRGKKCLLYKNEDPHLDAQKSQKSWEWRQLPTTPVLRMGKDRWVPGDWWPDVEPKHKHQA